MEGIILDADTKTDYEQALIDQEENQELSKDAIGREVMRRALEKINWTESQQKELEELYSFSVTQDFGDTYHMTEEERQVIYNLEEPIKRFKQKYSRKIRKVDKYVEAVRGWWEVVVFYSEHNAPFMDPEKFRMDVVKGDIIINNLYFPEYTGKRKKTMDWDMIIDQYIFGDRDPIELTKDKAEDTTEEKILARLSEEEQIIRLFGSVEEFNRIMEPVTEEEQKRWSRNDDELDFDDNYVEVLSKKESKHLRKVVPTMYRVIRDSLKVDAKTRRIYNDVAMSDMEWIEEYDEVVLKKKADDIPVWDGNMKHYQDFMDAMDAWEYENVVVDYHGRPMTQEEIDELETRDTIINVMGSKANVVFQDKKEKKRLRRIEKKDRSKKKRLKNMLKEIKKREKKIKDGKYDELLKKDKKEMINTKENKKFNKKKRKKDKKNKKKNKKLSEQITLDAVGRKERTWKDYERKMSDGDWFPGRTFG